LTNLHVYGVAQEQWPSEEKWVSTIRYPLWRNKGRS